MLDRARQYLAARSMQVMFVSWRDTVINMKQRKLLALEVDRFYNKKVYPSAPNWKFLLLNVLPDKLIF